MSEPKITFIGGGNMARAIYRGLVESGFPAENIGVVDPSEAAQSAARASGLIRIAESATDADLSADLIVLAVKPQITDIALSPLAHRVSSTATVLSIIAGINSASLANLLGLPNDDAVVRSMPNTPALVGEGMTGLFSNSDQRAHGRILAERVMSAVGQCVWVSNESDLDLVTAISGSGPAYFFLFMESLADAAVELGMSPQTAHQLSVQTALGAAKLAQASDDGLAKLRENVTSPGGTTEQAIESFEASELRAIVMSATRAAKKRSIELSEEFGL
ncbi:pyrroline-5-carboxylate reductase [Luminiphilus sp.]|nr:pyrroline-5-carboxylate reductase [Luminiphilus sp.]MDA8814638.1 pyrroline-5-carboxylate reductase [Luminiphilus sp.]MDB2585313.1 pyrroline-5-carboxylate reductase [Luminiphilus sp.]MDB2660000.1 pyrroline-5-carboxylate reductase [Luminiphilus sp.]MDB3932768.1 pyrroline-5-carboxylate reductase [Luminiphilus sp.]